MELVKQRIKYLVEHGELYTAGEQRKHDRTMMLIVLVMLALNTVETTILLAQYWR
jgi:hypothetical protein